MKKTLISLAVVAGMAASGAALAEATVYGNVHISINDVDSNANGVDMTSNTSHLGFKASEDVGGGIKAFAKIEFQPDTVDGGNLGYRDALVGIKGGMGSVKFGQFSSNYKQMGGKVDPMYRTGLEGRGGLLGIQSAQHHGGRGDTRGRQTNSLQWSSPKMGGIQAVVNTTLNNNNDETVGLGVRYIAKSFGAYVDTIKIPVGATTKSATKFGGWFKTGDLKLSAQIEDAADTTTEDYTFVAASFKINKNDTVAASFGTVSGTGANTDRTGVALMYKHKMSKKTNVYVGYGDRSDDKNACGVTGTTSCDDSAFTLGLQKKF